MAGRFTHIVGKTQYYKLPVEAWRGLLDNPGQTLRLCKSIMCADCENHNQLSDVYGWHFTASTQRENNKTFGQYKKEGAAFIEGLRGGVRVCFTIPRTAFWQYNEEQFGSGVKEWDWLLLLWWMALHTIDGNRKGMAIKNTSNADIFRRAAGFATWADYKAYRWNGDETILKYIANPARYAVRLRDDLMQKYDTFHAYSEKGRRGWCFMIADVNRQRAFDLMAEHMAKRGGTKQQFKNELADMKARARERAAGGGMAQEPQPGAKLFDSG